MNIDISHEEYMDRRAVEEVRNFFTGKAVVQIEDPIFQKLFEIHKIMWPLHDHFMQTDYMPLKAHLAEMIFKLNGLRATVKNENRSYYLP